MEAVDRAVKGAGRFPWDIAPLPAGPKGLFGFIGGQSIGVCAGAKNKEAALDWLFHVVGVDGQKELVRRQIGLPTIKAQLDSPDWKNAPSAPPHAGVVVEMLGKARPIAKTNLWRTLATNAFNENITKMNNGDLSAREACALMDDLGTKTLQSGA
jgi:multiple sugar transport system substrate-binding protein